MLADQVGLDLVTFQDHPYQPAMLDTWTLLCYVAARTDHVRLAPNVANLPLRDPALLARSVASLDLLTGGRAELGIGAGSFWDAIVAMDGRRLSPGESVDALTEAIEVIRGIWDVTASGALNVRGKHYRVTGTKRGPATAHPVPILVGAYQPRMLRLTARLADGWLPSTPYLKPGQLTEANAIIDDAAAEAGRDPAAIRRLLNLAAEQDQPEQLAELALAEGISTFIAMADGPASISRFAAEVAPAVRELVAAGRSGRRSQASARPSATIRTARPAARSTATSSGADAELVAVHNMLRSELERLRDLIGQVRDGQIGAAQARNAINEMTMRQNNWTMGAYCESYCRVVTTHHSLEDAAVFPMLRSREPGLAPVLDRLQAEHVTIHKLLDEIDHALVRYINEPDNLTGLAAAVDVMSDALLTHLSYEESQLLDPLARHGF